MIRKKQILTEYMGKSKNKTQENRIQILLTRKTKKSWPQIKFSITEPPSRVWSLGSAQCTGTHGLTVIESTTSSTCPFSYVTPPDTQMVSEKHHLGLPKSREIQMRGQKDRAQQNLGSKLSLCLSHPKRKIESILINFFLSPISPSSLNKS